MDRVKIGLVGGGLFGESHLQALRAVPGAKVAAIFDVDRARAEELAAAFHIARACASLEEICSLPGLNASTWLRRSTSIASRSRRLSARASMCS